MTGLSGIVRKINGLEKQFYHENVIKCKPITKGEINRKNIKAEKQHTHSFQSVSCVVLISRVLKIGTQFLHLDQNAK